MFIVDPCYLRLKGEPMLSTATPLTNMSAAPTKRAKQLLHISVSTWVTIALIGQWFFATYVFVLYVFPIVTGNPELVNLSKPIVGYVKGDTFGNVSLFYHVIPAALLSVGGIIQLLPIVANCAQKVSCAASMEPQNIFELMIDGALSGLYLTWIRGARLSDVGSLGITLNGILIIIAVVFAWRYARAKQFDIPMYWAVHVLLLVNGVWLFRLYLMAWYVANQGSNGHTENLDGLMDIFISFACYGIRNDHCGVCFLG